MKDLSSKKIYNTLLATLIVIVVGVLIAYPQTTFKGAAKGIDSWLKIVFPSLLPFFIGAEIMISLGIVDFMSTLLTPIMEPLFGCSGSSSFVWAMSATSGYPTCARIVTSLRQDRRINKTEAQRILAFASTSGPLFMLGAIGIGMLNSPKSGRIIAISHYTSALIMGLIFKYYGWESKYLRQNRIKSTHILEDAIDNMYKARQKDGRSFGQILGDSVKSSFEALTMVGGFLILFSALIHLVLGSKPMEIFSTEGIAQGIISGLLEMTTGCMIMSQSSAPFATKIAGICFVIGWSGLSVHCQVISMISQTDISVGVYIITKLMHGIVSAIIGWTMARYTYTGDIKAFNPSSQINLISINFISRYSIKLFICAVILLIFIGVLTALIHRRLFRQ